MTADIETTSYPGRPPRSEDGPRTRGVILCGGKSRRFGRSKVLHAIDGTTFLDRAMDAVRPFVDTICLSIGNSSRERWPEVELVRDQHAEIGPMGGIHAAISGFTDTWFLVLAVDMPFVSHGSLKQLVDTATEGTVAAIARDSQGRVHPLCGLFHRDLLPAIEHAIGDQMFSVQDLLSRLDNVRYVTLPGGDLRNVNRMEDLP